MLKYKKYVFFLVLILLIIIPINVVKAISWEDYKVRFASPLAPGKIDAVSDADLDVLIINLLEVEEDDLSKEEISEAIEWTKKLKSHRGFNDLQMGEGGIKYNGKVYSNYEDALNKFMSNLEKAKNTDEKQKEEINEVKNELDESSKKTNNAKHNDNVIKDVNTGAVDGNDLKFDNTEAKIYKQPNIITGRGNVDGTLDDMISDADSFVSKGNQADAIEIDGLKKLSVRLYDILLEIGIGAAVLIGIILGIKFLLSGVEEKAEVNKMLWVYTVGCIVTFGAFGIWKLVVTILQKI